MTVDIKYLIVGPEFHIGEQAARNTHLINLEPGRDKRTACGRLPTDSWIPMSEVAYDKIGCKIMECPTCKRSKKLFELY